MNLEIPETIGVGVAGGLITALGFAIAKVRGSGKERMDFQQSSRVALESQIRNIQEQLNVSWAENKQLRQSWVADYTAHENVRNKLEDDRTAHLVRISVLEGENKLLLQKIVVLERENARLRAMAADPNRYPSGYIESLSSQQESIPEPDKSVQGETHDGNQHH